MAAPPPRIAITGIGVVSPFGVGRDRYWDHVSRGVSGTRAIDEFDTSSFACQVAAPLPALSIEEAPAVLPAISVNGNGHNSDDRADPRRYSRAPRSRRRAKRGRTRD
jgi:3-oxoacyl-(acyl-carrier-protein) synthase